MSVESPFRQTTNKNYQNFLVKGLKHQCIGMNIKQKVIIMHNKTPQTSKDIFLNQNV